MKVAFASFLAKTQKLPTKRIPKREPKNRPIDSSGLLLRPIIFARLQLTPATKYVGINPPPPLIEQQLVSKDVGESRRASLEREVAIRRQNLAGILQSHSFWDPRSIIGKNSQTMPMLYKRPHAQIFDGCKVLALPKHIKCLELRHHSPNRPKREASQQLNFLVAELSSGLLAADPG